MKILFLCGSLEPGHDGVGDYTRRLCGELIKKGHQTQILSLYDYHSKTFSTEKQEFDHTEIVVHRVALETSNAQRFTWSQDILKEFQPDWISLQFVPYSFNAKGLPFWIPSFLKRLKGNHKWHIMFHELWLGIDLEASIKHKIIGKAQQVIIQQLITKNRPHFITTQNQLYQFFLHSHNITSEVLPICGNIPLNNVTKQEIGFTQFVLFGTIHPGAPFEDFIGDLLQTLDTFVKPIKFVFIGKNGSELDNYLSILENNNIVYEVLGIQSESEISQVLINSDYGISTTPYLQTEKSGVYAAYREHRINTISVSRNWTPAKGHYDIKEIIKYEKNNLKITPIDAEVFDLNCMTDQFINSISKI